MGGQLRAVPGAALGWDLSAALALAAALGVDPRFAAEILPEIDRVILLRSGRIVCDGPKSEVLTAANLRRAFDVPLAVSSDSGYYHVRVRGDASA